MPPLGLNQVLLIIIGMFFIYVVAAMFAAEGWVIYRLVTRRPVLPVRPLVSRREVSWGIWTVLLTFVIYFLVSLGCFWGYAKLTGRKAARPATPPPAAPASQPDGSSSPPLHLAKGEKKPAEPAVKPVETEAADLSKAAVRAAKDHAIAVSDAKSTAGDLGLSFTELMAIGAFTDLVLLIVFPLMLRVTSPTPLRDIGLSFEHWWLQAAVGVVALLAIAPILYGLQFAMLRIWENHKHPLQNMVMEEFSPGVAQLAVLTAVVAAPLFEEMMFRGIIQGWLVSLGSRRRRDSKPVVLENLGDDELAGPTPVAPSSVEAVQSGSDSQARAEPGLETTKPGPDISTDRRPSGLAGIVVTSLIFAAVHGPQWPAPVPIFVLALAMGIVYHRTGSLIAAICMHATFNGLATLALLAAMLAPQSAQRPKEPKVNAPAPVASFYKATEGACTYCEKNEL